MVKAILIPLELPNTQDLVNCLKSYKLLNSTTRLFQTPTNAKLSVSLTSQLALCVCHVPDFPSTGHLKQQILENNDSVFIAPSSLLKALMLELFPYKGERNFEGIGYVLNTQGKEIKETPLQIQHFPEYYSDSDSDCDLENTAKTMEIVQQEILDYSLRTSQLQVHVAEMAKTNSMLSLNVSEDIQKKFEKIEKILKRNSEKKDPDNKEVLKLIEKFEGLNENVERLVDRLENLQIFCPTGKIDFSSIKVVNPKYEIGSVIWTHQRSVDNSSHVFTIRNSSEYFLKDLNIYNSDDEHAMVCFKLNPGEETQIECDFLVDILKIVGEITFEVFYCCYPLAEPIRIYCIEICKIEKIEGNRYLVNFQCSVTAMKGLQLMNNDVVNIKSLSTKNFENGRVAMTIKDYKGEHLVYFLKENKVISNKFRLNI